MSDRIEVAELEKESGHRGGDIVCALIETRAATAFF